MKKLSVLLLVLVSVMAISLSACTIKGNGDHEHHFGEYVTNDVAHWKECTCGETTDYGEHTFNGNKCTVCNYEKKSSGGSQGGQSGDNENSDGSQGGNTGDEPQKVYRTVTFNVNGGDEKIDPRQFEVGALMTNLPNPTRKGYDFIEWIDVLGFEYNASTIMPNMNLELFAQWEKQIGEYSDEYVSFKPASEGWKDVLTQELFKEDVDKALYVELTSDDIGGPDRVGKENNFNLRMMEGMEYSVKLGYSWIWYQGNFNNPNGAQRFTLKYGSNIQLVTISDNTGLVLRTYLLDIYVKHDYYISLFTDIFAEEPYEKVRVIENKRFSPETEVYTQNGYDKFEFDYRVYFNSETQKYEKFVYTTAIRQNWNLYQTYKPYKLNIDLADGTLPETKDIMIKPYEKHLTLPIPTKNGYDFIGWQLDDAYFTDITGYSAAEYLDTENASHTFRAVFAAKRMYCSQTTSELQSAYSTIHTVPVVTYTDETQSEILEVTYVPYNTDCALPSETPNVDDMLFMGWKAYNKETGKGEKFDFNTKVIEPIALYPAMEKAGYFNKVTGNYTGYNAVPLNISKMFDEDDINTDFRANLPSDSTYTLKITTSGSMRLTVQRYGLNDTQSYNVDYSSPKEIVLRYRGNNQFTFPDGGYVDFKVTKLTGTFTVFLTGPTAPTDGEPIEDEENIHSVGEEVTIEAALKNGYIWTGWFKGKEMLTDDLEYTFEMPSENVTYTANLAKVTLDNNDDAAGTIIPYDEEKTYKVGDEVTITAKTNIGYICLGWYEGERQLTNEQSYTFAMPSASAIYTAKWKISEELKDFEFASTEITCTITGIKDKTKTELTVPDCVTNIQSGAFSGCDSLQSITIPFVGANKDQTGATYFGYLFGASKYSENSSYVPKSLRTVVITDVVTTIGDHAFYGCSGLTSVTIGKSVQTIGDAAFCGCYKLVEVYNLSKLDIKQDSNNGYVGNYALHIYNGDEKSSYIKEENDFIFYDDGTSDVYLLGYKGNKTELTLPNGYKGKDYEIYKYAFDSCSGLISITIGNSVKTIGESAFGGCSGLTSITIGSGVKTIGDSAFLDCCSLTSVTIPNSITTIGYSAFYNCSNLTSVTIPNSVTTIGYSAFNGCSGLTSITIPDSVTSIDNYVFYGCSGLTSITIPDNVTWINAYAFSGCSGLTSVTIPDSVTAIGLSAFSGCTSLTTVNWNATNCTSAGSYSYSYNNTIFYGCTALTTVNIGENVQTLPAYAFYGCSGLTSITIPDSVTSIGAYAFRNCNGLTSVTFKNPNNWQVTYYSGFSSSTSISSLSDSSTAAQYLTDTYDDCYWRRTA